MLSGGLVNSPALLPVDSGVREARLNVTVPSKTISAAHSSTLVSQGSIHPVTRATISTEYISLRYDKHCPTGLYITPSMESLLVWDAVLFVHKGYYAGSVFKFVVTFPDNYPERPPTVCFLTDVFHPLIATQTGSFNLAARFRPWRPKEHHVHDVLHFIKAAFKSTLLDKLSEVDSVNKEALKLYQYNRPSFAALAQQSSEFSQSTSALYGLPSSKKNYSFYFAPTTPEVVNSILETLSIHTSSGTK
ncbi:UBC-like protein [Phlebopus sp. FC_14]|nr:UBC-like protein [Phlebopus sp. FC_14]